MADAALKLMLKNNNKISSNGWKQINNNFHWRSRSALLLLREGYLRKQQQKKKKKSTYKKEMRDLRVDISAYQNNNNNGTTSLVKAIKETEHSRLSAESRSAKLKLRVYLDDNKKKKTREAQPATFPFFFFG